MESGKTQLPLCHLESETVLAGVICALFLLQSNHVDGSYPSSLQH